MQCASYCHLPIGMADNGSECVTSDTESQMKMMSITYSSVSLLSFVIGLIAILLNRCYYCRYKDKHQIDSMEEVYIIMMVICCIFAFSESFQWFALFDDFVGCTVLATVREYNAISLLAILVCLGTQLLILVAKPKCLKVINEVKLKRYKIIQKIYVTVSFLVPIIFVPWPFINAQYGKQLYLCWLRDHSGCGVTGIYNFLNRFLMWYFWALLVWLYIAAVFAFSFYTYCSHIRRTTWKPDLNITTIISLLTVYVVQVVISFICILWGWIQKHYPFILTFLVAVLTPLALMIVFIILIIRQVCIIRMALQRSRGIVTCAQTTVGTYQTVSERESISKSTFYPLPKDDWDI